MKILVAVLLCFSCATVVQSAQVRSLAAKNKHKEFMVNKEQEMGGKGLLLLGMLCSTYGAYSGNSIGQLVLAQDATRKAHMKNALYAQRARVAQEQVSVARGKWSPYQVKTPMQRQIRCKS